MSIGTKENDLNVQKKKMEQKINMLNESGIIYQIQDILDDYITRLDPKTIRNFNVNSRIKKFSSAFEKIVRQNNTVEDIHDLIGIMITVPLPDDYVEIKEDMQKYFHSAPYRHDFTAEKDNGYSSFHLGIDTNTLLKEHNKEKWMVPDSTDIEIQLKTYGMYIAQESTHDSIYKNNILSNDEKNKLQSVMFPFIEKITDKEMYIKKLESVVSEKEKETINLKILSVQEDIEQIKESNNNFFENNPKQIENILNSYIAIKFAEKIKQNPQLNLKSDSIENIKSSCLNAVSYLSENEKIDQNIVPKKVTGFKKN